MNHQSSCIRCYRVGRPSLPLLLLLTLVFLSSGAFLQALWAIKNVCPSCKIVSHSEDTHCQYCGYSLNRCLGCNHDNTAAADFCASCSAPLAESRILRTIATATRSELKLGQSKRAVLDRELQKIDFLLERTPEKRELLLFRKGKALRQMLFSARECGVWEQFLQEFPHSRKKVIVNVYLSEALRRWSYLFYEQKDLPAALAKLEAAVTANPGNGEAWSWLSRVRFESNDFAGAEEAARKSLDLLPEDETAAYILRRARSAIRSKAR